MHVLKHARWVHRARFLSRLPESGTAGIYLDTVPGDYPYLTFVHGLDTEDFMDPLEETGGLAEELSESQWSRQILDGLAADRVTRFSPADPLRGISPGGSNGLWRDEYCGFCTGRDCPADSIERDRCARLAYVIGAWDPVETRDIYLLYRQGKETLQTVYVRIARHENLSEILEIARPRWPDAFEE